ncbi:hypothetical protein N7451_001796 [Penicillium sp. IBT 35674x]|nr:hypothetical protein N7451_001796 [Penicillium sp. IBT 35674x]
MADADPPRRRKLDTQRNRRAKYIPRACTRQENTRESEKEDTDMVLTSSNRDKSALSWRERLSQLEVEIQQLTQKNTSPPTSDLWSEIEVSSGVLLADSHSPHSLENQADLYKCDVQVPPNVSIASQLAVLRATVRAPSASQQPPLERAARLVRPFPFELPRPRRVRHLLDVYFRDMDSFFPFLDREDLNKRVFSALHLLGYSDHATIVDVGEDNHILLAVLCNVLMMGECLDPDEQSEDTRPGWTMYMRGRKLLQHFSSLRGSNLDLICYHTLSTLYLLHSELIQPAGQAIRTAIQMAMFARLNDQSVWAACSAEQINARKRLWWTIYFLDRRISQRSGMPYTIHDRDVAVDEFKPKRNMVAMDSTDSSKDGDYVQALIDLGRTWGYIWDTLFAASAASQGDCDEIELADARILLIRRHLPSQLSWSTDHLVSTYLAQGEAEPQIRRRLAMFVRINLSRMIIRQNPLWPCQGNSDMKHFCALVAHDTIEAIALYIWACGRVRPSGFFFITSLVECMYHLMSALQDSALKADHETALEAFRIADQVLEDLSKTLSSASRARAAIQSIINPAVGTLANNDETELVQPDNDPHSTGGSQHTAASSPRDDEANEAGPGSISTTHPAQGQTVGNDMQIFRGLADSYRDLDCSTFALLQ